MDIAQLGISVDSRPVVTGEQDLDRLAASGERTEKRVVKSTTNMNRSFLSTAKGARGLTQILSGPGMRNASLQLSQVAQQVQATGDPIRALAIQLPDLTLGFGPLGIAAGVFAGALLPMAANLLGAADGAKAMEDAVEGLDESLKALQARNDAVNVSIVELMDTYGAGAAQASELLEIQRELSFLDATRTLNDARDSIVSAFGDVRDVVDETGLVIRDNFGRTVRELQRDFGISADLAAGLTSAFGDLADAGTLEQQRDALKDTRELLLLAIRDLGDMDGEARNMLGALLNAEDAALRLSAIDLASSFRDGANEAARLADNLARASGSRFNAITGNNPDFFDPRNESGNAGRIFRDVAVPAENRPGYKPPGSRNRGGRSAADRERLELEREAQRIFQATRTELELFNIQMKEINDLYKSGHIDLETYNRAMADLDQNYIDAYQSANDLAAINEQVENSFGNTFTSIVTGAESAQEAVSGLLTQMAELLAQQAFTGLLGGVGGGGGFLAGILGLPSADGGGYTGNGPRSGGLDGKGGFLAMLHPQETVIDHTKGQGGGVTVIINAPNAEVGFVERMVQELDKRMPEIERRAVAAVGNASRRGYS